MKHKEDSYLIQRENRRGKHKSHISARRFGFSKMGRRLTDILAHQVEELYRKIAKEQRDKSYKS